MVLHSSLFFDSNQTSSDFLQMMDEIEKLYAPLPFYRVDKQSPKNDPLFSMDDYQQLPKVFIFNPPEMLAEAI